MGHAMQNDRRRQPEGRNRQDGHDIEPGSGARAPREARASRGRRPAGRPHQVARVGRPRCPRGHARESSERRDRGRRD